MLETKVCGTEVKMAVY